jgi:glycosyltransferase involved in cell wall biosynthesis
VEIVTIPLKWYPPERLLDAIRICRLIDLTECAGGRVDLLIGLKFPAYYIPHPNKVLWILHQHRAAYDLWGHQFGDLHRFPDAARVRQAIEQADREFLPEARAIFANSANVARRLKAYCGIEARPLYHPPPHAEDFYCSEPGDYLLCPSRLVKVKRQELVVEALRHTKNPVEVYFTGVADEAAYEGELRSLARRLELDQRVLWLRTVSEEDKIRYYAQSLGVVFPPVDEDLGYVTLEAMLASKPVITCVDSGGPLEFVLPWKTGLVVEPTVHSLAEAMDILWENREQAKAWGRAARKHYASLNISWQDVVEKLLGSPGDEMAATQDTSVTSEGGSGREAIQGRRLNELWTCRS